MFSDPRIPFIVHPILPVTPLPGADAVEARDRLDPGQIFGVLVAQLPLDPQAQRGAVGDRQPPAVERPGEDRLRVERIDEVAAFIIIGIADAVAAAKDDVARAVLQPRRGATMGTRNPGPFADRAPPLTPTV